MYFVEDEDNIQARKGLFFIFNNAASTVVGTGARQYQAVRPAQRDAASTYRLKITS